MRSRPAERGWSLLMLRGMIAGAVGGLILAWPRLSLATLALIFGVYALVEGAATLVGAALRRTVYSDGRLARMQGLAGVAVGVIVLDHPAMTVPYLLTQLALRAAAIGGIDGLAGFMLLERTRRRAWLLPVCGLAPALVGALALSRVGVDPLGARWYLEASALTTCICFLALGAAIHLESRAPAFGRAQPHRVGGV